MAHRLGISMNKLTKDKSKSNGSNLCKGLRPTIAAVGVVGMTFGLFACGGSTANTPPPSATPAPNAIASTSPVSASAEPVASSAASATPAADAAKGPPAVEDKPKAVLPESKDNPAGSDSASSAEHRGTAQPSQSPADALTAARVAFLIDYANSDAKTKALANCEKDPKKDDPTAKAACMQKARSQFLPDVLVFLKDKKGHVTLTIYKRNDSQLKEVYVAPVSFADETPNSLRLKFKGGGSGQRPLFKNTNSPMLNMPNDYTLEVEDSEFGKLRYDAKIGLVDK